MSTYGELSKPIDIVLLLQDLEFGGTQRYAIHLLKNLNRRLFSPQLWILRGGMDMVPLALESGIRPVWLSRASWVGPHSLSHLAWRLLRHRPQILYTLTSAPTIWGRLLGSITKVPVIVSSWRNTALKQYESWMWPLSTRIICNANALKDDITLRHGVDLKRVAVIPNGVDAEFFTPDKDQKSGKPAVLYIGSLVPKKNPLALLEGFRLTAERVPDARFDIIGNGYLKGQMKRFICRHALESRIRMLPGRPDIRHHLRRAWIFAMASNREGSPNVILEAMAAGLPVVATRVGGVPELVEEGVTGILVERGDPQDLADALIDCLSDKAQRRAMGLKARERVLAHHSLEKVVKQTEKVLMEAIDESRT